MLFTLGEKLVDGKEEGKPFQLGFTTVAHLENIRDATYFHLDATYKVHKSGFALITFGVTDIRRHYFPIAYMLTSEESTDAYYSFFASLIDIVHVILPEVTIDMKYCVCDAANAMSKAIGFLWPDCVVIMCW